MVEKIVSGGQTGADRASLDAAIKTGIPHGGWIPKGRITESGPLPLHYNLKEMPDRSYAKRTEQNVINSQGTLIVSHGRLVGGSKLTRLLALKHSRPCFHVDLDLKPASIWVLEVKNWLFECSIKVLNVAGPRASGDPSIYECTLDLLVKILNK